MYEPFDYSPGQAGLVAGGGRSNQQFADFYKAVAAGAQVDPTGLTGGAALRRESLEASIATIIQKRKHLVALNTFPTSKATAVVDSWTRRDDVGGLDGSSVNRELDDANESTGSYEREIGIVKFLMDKRRVSGIAEIQSDYGLMSAIALETDNGSLKVASDVEWLTYYGDSSCDDAEFDGLFKQLSDLGGENVIDLQGGTFSPDAREFVEAASVITAKDHWGEATDFFASPKAQVDLNLTLGTAWRFNLTNRAEKAVVGSPVEAVNTGLSDVPIRAHIARFIQEGQAPFSVRGTKYAAFIVGTLSAPTAIVGTPAPDAGSLFTADKAGLYYYAAEAAASGIGRSALTKSAQVTVAIGDSVTVAITEPVSQKGTHYILYRNNLNGADADGDFREMVRVPVNGGGTTTYVDANQNIPGTSFVPVCTVLDDAITVRRFGDQFRFPLWPTTKFEHPWLQLWFGYLRIAKPVQHVLIKNVLPNGAKWRPFNV